MTMPFKRPTQRRTSHRGSKDMNVCSAFGHTTVRVRQGVCPVTLRKLTDVLTALHKHVHVRTLGILGGASSRSSYGGSESTESAFDLVSARVAVKATGWVMRRWRERRPHVLRRTTRPHQMVSHMA